MMFYRIWILFFFILSSCSINPNSSSEDTQDLPFDSESIGLQEVPSEFIGTWLRDLGADTVDKPYIQIQKTGLVVSYQLLSLSKPSCSLNYVGQLENLSLKGLSGERMNTLKFRVENGNLEVTEEWELLDGSESWTNGPFSYEQAELPLECDALKQTKTLDLSQTGEQCGSFEGLASREELALSPREHAEAEQIIVNSRQFFEGIEDITVAPDDYFVAPQDVYDRVVSDLSAIRSDFPEVSNIKDRIQPVAIYLGMDLVGQLEIAEGSYHGYDCQNQWYGGKRELPGTTINGFEVSSSPAFSFPGRFNTEMLKAEYEKALHVNRVEIIRLEGSGDSVCLDILPDRYLYVFSHGFGGCPSGCINREYYAYTTDAAGNRTKLGEWFYLTNDLEPELDTTDQPRPSWGGCGFP